MNIGPRVQAMPSANSLALHRRRASAGLSKY